MSRPKISAGVAGTLTAAIPSRLVKKLDADPTMAERWTWTATSIDSALPPGVLRAPAKPGLAITTDKGEVVKLVLTAEVITEVTCSCLLGPKCLHVAAVVALLEPAEGTREVAPDKPDDDAPPAVAAEALGSDAVAASQRAFRAVADVLAGGAEVAGAFAQAELLRAIHACRTEGLHRLAATQTRALRSIRELRADKAEFALEVLTADLRDALSVAHAIGGGANARELVGTARRDYETVGNLRLRGVFTEAIVARSGYAGAITYLVDDKGNLYTRADVAPGDAGRAAGAYDAAAGIGDAVLPHRELCRTGLFVSNATASSDGRLGAGQKVKAVRASEPSRWDSDQLVARFGAPLVDQLATIAAHDAEPDELRPAGWDLAFLEGMIIGGPGGVGVIAQGDVLVRFTTAHEQRALAVRDNLVVLGRASGLVVRAIGRVRVGSPRQVDLLAIGPGTGETRFTMAEAWHGRANVHYDRLSIPSLGELPAGVNVAPAPPTDDLLSPLRRRVERAVLGGAGTLPTHAIGELDREAAQLADKALRGGAEVLRDLAALAHDAARSATGVRRALDRTTFAHAWLRAALYEDAARRRLSVASW